MNTHSEERLFALNIPGNVIEVTEAEANELGAFEEDALSEDEAMDATEETTDDDEEEEEEFMATSKSPKLPYHEQITNKLIEQLKVGTAP